MASLASRRILIVKTSSLGDVVHALPAVTDLVEACPAAGVDWVVEEAFADIPRLHPGVAQVIPVALRGWRRAPLAGSTRSAVAAVRTRLRAGRYDVVIDCQGLVKSAVLARWARAPVAGYDRRSAREPLATLWYDRRFRVDRALHAIVRNRTLVAAAAGYAMHGPPRFGIAPPPAADGGATVPETYAVLLTNASRATKRWPDAHWRAVAESLAALGLPSLLFWGSDDERIATAARAARMPDARVMPRATIAAIAAVLARARVVVGLDTGLTHLAAALGAPTLGIFCDYDPSLVGVVGDAATVSLGSAVAGPGVDDVLAALPRLLAADASAGTRAACAAS